MASKETPASRIARLENIAIAHDESIDALIEGHKALLESQRRTDALFARLRQESEEREKRMDERIDKLVSAIGKFIRRNGK